MAPQTFRTNFRPAAKPLLSTFQFEFRLKGRAHSWLFLSALTATGLALAYSAGKAATAEVLVNSHDITWVERAARLDPAYSGPQYQLGVLRLFSLEKADQLAAVQHLLRASELNPGSGPYWLALATASERLGDVRSAQGAFQRAVERRPMSPEYWWKAANFYLRHGQDEASWARFRRVLELDPGRAELVFRLCYKTAGDSRIVSEQVLPPAASPALRFAYADFLSRQRDFIGAFSAWNQLGSDGLVRNASFTSAQPYLDGLIAVNRTEEAMSVWSDLLKWHVIARPISSNPGDTVFNGGFEQAPLNGGFDWRAPWLNHVATNLEAPESFQGSKSARVDFSVKQNEEYEILHQFVPVDPRREYRLRAFIRSEGITSDSGPRLRIVDAISPASLNVITPSVVGTTDWHPIELAFSTGPGTRLVRIAVWRARCRTFPTEITGRFWIDSVSIVAATRRSEVALSRQLRYP